jgi:hypothetical protein
VCWLIKVSRTFITILWALLLGGLHPHEAHPRAPGSLADCLGVVAIVVLGAFHEGLHILRRDQANVVTQGAEFPSPVVGTATRFHGDLGGGKLFKEGDHLRAAKVGSQDRLTTFVDAVQGENSLGRIVPMRVIWDMDGSGLGL